MNLFLKKLFSIFILIVLILISFYPLDNILSNNLKKSNRAFKGEIDIWNTIYTGQANAKIAVYGSSRAWVHIDPLMIENAFNKTCFNYGIDGHSFWLQYLRHLEIINNNSYPETIILSVDINTLQNRKGLYNLEQFFPYIQNKNIVKYTKRYEGLSWFDYNIPFIRYAKYKEAFWEAINPDTTQLRLNGFRAQNKEWNKDFLVAKTKLGTYTAKLDSSTITLFDQFLKNCQKNNCDIILVYTPEYIEGQKFVVNRGEIISIFSKFALEYNIPFLDYSNNEICFDKNKFYNASHLNKDGAKKFTQMLIDDISKERLLVKNQ